MDYTGVLMYEYSDVDRRALKEFTWKICRGSSVEEVIDQFFEGRSCRSVDFAVVHSVLNHPLRVFGKTDV